MADTMPDAPSSTGGGIPKKVEGVQTKYLAIIFVGALVLGLGYRYWKSHQTVGGTTVAPSPTISPATVPADTGTPNGFPTAGGNNLGGTFAYSGNGAGTSTYSTLGTNGAWATAAADGLTGQGYNPLDVQNALASYIAGSPATAAQQAIIDAAIAAYGSPPEGVTASTLTTAAPRFSFQFTQDNNGPLWSLFDLNSGKVIQTRSQQQANLLASRAGVNASTTSISSLIGTEQALQAQYGAPVQNVSQIGSVYA